METNPNLVFMAQLSPFTCRRLKKLTKILSTWEGDRRPINASLPALGLVDEDEPSVEGDCIMWVDNAQGVIRAMSIVPADSNHEAVVRSLIQAMERPPGNLDPTRPRKLIVRDREIQFFLRGALQSLDIEIEYSPELPLIDEIFQTLLQLDEAPPPLPEAYAKRLNAAAAKIWADAPWYLFTEQEIFAIELNHWNIDTLYLSILGMADVEYGLLLYRSLDSLQLFRQKILNSEQLSRQEVQDAFLSQDCLFINFEITDDYHDDPDQVDYDFGSIHPLEGIRNELADEEAATFIVVLDALHRFFQKHDSEPDEFGMNTDVCDTFRINNPIKDETPKTIKVAVRTLPEISQELAQETEDAFTSELYEEANHLPEFYYDTIPDGSFVSLSAWPPDLISNSQNGKAYYQSLSKSDRKWNKPDLLPVLILQTTRPKANDLTAAFKSCGGVEAICFNKGTDIVQQTVYKLGLIKTTDGSFHMFNEYDLSTPRQAKAIEKWEASQQASQGRCCVIIAAGVSGKNRGNPTNSDIVGVFETYFSTPEALNLSPMILNSSF
jgi:hypothetical protein